VSGFGCILAPKSQHPIKTLATLFWRDLSGAIFYHLFRRRCHDEYND